MKIICLSLEALKILILKKMNRIYLYSLVLICFFFANQIQASNDINILSKQVKLYSANYPQEKVYLHFDNTEYFEGETIWFKTYVVQADRNALSNLSNTLYVELLDEEGSIKLTNKIQIKDGKGSGSIFLKDLLYAGYYEIRAYTRAMLNSGSENIFSRVFPVYDIPKDKGDYSNREIKKRPVSQRTPGPRKDYLKREVNTITFMPEGGNLVNGIKSRVAFQAFEKTGQNAAVSGIVLSEKGDTLAEFNTSNQNMGVFYMTPQIGKNKAKVKFKDKEYRFDFPEVKPEGYVMTVDALDQTNLTVLVRKSPGTISEHLGLNITCRGRLYGSDSLIIGDENALTLSFPKKMLPSGVSQITLFNTKGEVLAERMVFVNHNSQMKIELIPNKPLISPTTPSNTNHPQTTLSKLIPSYSPFEKVSFDFRLSDIKDNPIETDFSVSVRDAATTNSEPNTDNILTNLLLSSELKGYIDKPGQYFEKDDQQSRQDLDLLMLTQGWSRYVWKKMSGVETTNTVHPFEKGLYMEGRVVSLYGKKPRENVEVLMILTNGDQSQHNKCLTDKEGRFYFSIVDFNEKADVILQTKTKGKRKEHYIMLDRVFSPGVKDYSFYEQQIPFGGVETFYTLVTKKNELITDTIVTTPKTEEKELTMEKKSHMLKEVILKDKRQYARENEGLRNATMVIDVNKKMDDFRDLGKYIPSNLNTFMYEINPYFVEYATDSGGLIQRYKGRKIISVFNNKYIGFGLPDFIMSDVETLMISDKPGVSLDYIGQAGADGINIVGDEVVFNLYGKIKNKEAYGIRNTTFQGYSLVKEFFSPQYDKIVLPDDKDYRRTLYWNPFVKTDKEGKATITFYNNHSCKQMQINAETVTEKGVIGSFQKTGN